MDLITYLEEAMSLLPQYTPSPSRSVDNLYYKAKEVYQLHTDQEVLLFSTLHLN